MLPYKEEVKLDLFPLKSFTNHCTVDGAYASPPHWHGEIEILYVLEGRAIQQLGDTSFLIQKGDIVIIWKGQFHSTFIEKNCSCIIEVIQFCLENIAVFVDKRDLPFLLETLVFSGCISKDCVAWGDLFACIDRIICETRQKRQGYKFLARAAVYELCGHILRKKDCLPVAVKNIKYSQKAVRLMEFVEQNYDNHLTLKRAAKKLNFCPAHLSRMFKEITGMPFLQYLNFCRVEKAAALLENGSNVTEAAMKCGFCDVNTFIRNFKHWKNCTPSKFRTKTGANF